MTEKPKLEVVSEQLNNPGTVFDDLASLRKASKLTVQRKAVLVNVAVDKPPNNCYFRCHRELVLDDTTVVRDTQGTSKATYFVCPHMRAHPKLAPRLRKVTLVLTSTWPSGNILIWPVPILGERSFPAWKSARAAYELARDRWVQMAWSEEKRLPDRDRRGHRPRASMAREEFRGVAQAWVRRQGHRQRGPPLCPATARAHRLTGGSSSTASGMPTLNSGKMPTPTRCRCACLLTSSTAAPRSSCGANNCSPSSAHRLEGPRDLMVAYAANAELSCFLALGWPFPCNVLDLYVETIAGINGRADIWPQKGRPGL